MVLISCKPSEYVLCNIQLRTFLSDLLLVDSSFDEELMMQSRLSFHDSAHLNQLFACLLLLRGFLVLALKTSLLLSTKNLSQLFVCFILQKNHSEKTKLSLNLLVVPRSSVCFLRKSIYLSMNKQLFDPNSSFLQETNYDQNW